MQIEYLIDLEKFCSSHKIEISFISSLQETGLIEITTIENEGYIKAGQLRQLENYIHLFYELNINLEGIDSISNLLLQIESLQNDVIELRNRLRLYE